MRDLPAQAYADALIPFASWGAGRPAGWFTLPMTPDKVAFYRENGFIVIEDAVDPDTLRSLIRETVALCRGERGPIQGVTPGRSKRER